MRDENKAAPAKLRTELLQDRIDAMQKRLQDLKQTSAFTEEEDDQGLKNIYTNSSDLNSKYLKIKSDEENVLNKEITQFKNEGLLLLNIDNLALRNKNLSLEEEVLRLKQEIKTLNSNSVIQMSMIAELTKTNEELIQINLMQEQHISNLKGKAFGGDISNKYEANRKRQSLVNEYSIPEGVNMNNNLWDKDNVGYQRQYKIDDFAKEKQLWISNTSNTLNKLKADNTLNVAPNNVNVVGNQSRLNLGNKKDSDAVSTNMGRYSKLIIQN